MRRLTVLAICAVFGLVGCGDSGGGGTAWLPLTEESSPGLYRLSTAQLPSLDDLPGPIYAHRKVDDQRYFLYDEMGKWDEGWCLVPLSPLMGSPSSCGRVIALRSTP